jgi:Secretion system C-terminal sorting domain
MLLYNGTYFEFLESLGLESEYFDSPGGFVRFSPSGEYIYMCERDTIFQFDLSLPFETILENKYTVAVYDDALTQIWGGDDYFYTNLMGPPTSDRWIVSGWGNYFSSLSNLDALGDSVIFESQIYHVPQATVTHNLNYHDNTNYALFDFADSPCDTLGIDGPPIVLPSAVKSYQPKLKDVQVWPNPVSELLTLRGNSGQGDVVVSISDPLGRVVFYGFWANGVIRYQIDVTALVPQIYTLSLTSSDGEVIGRQISVLR